MMWRVCLPEVVDGEEGGGKGRAGLQRRQNGRVDGWMDADHDSEFVAGRRE
jgi:hypothetical protein